ncbi:MAG: type II secretion system protein GspG [Candidatus Lambdaproteobacteria bacterium RIFOXYD2_FULL_50_16]|uniref:Type II secretion system core protein G n=1 Tax=Candidatus Lambdaproteobacteria bacterium RIFOXYD2_FULL_50_16 TaxID=1817772 RepID=A0A1F6GFX8_9PROT|nr:MAG: type II secretion system protein GspG [Candidatus Lambdaproteobacteria bacterium RIFOXYD2_FULL_50_16]
MGAHQRQRGFSFIEIMIVIVLMAGIAAFVGPALFSKLDDAKVDQAKIQMKSLAGSLELYRLDNSRYPDSEQGLAALMAKPSLGRIPESWRGPYLNAKSLPKDPWERDYVYNSDGSNFDLMSLGADGEPGGQDRDQDIAHQ